jgi:transposase
MSMAPNRNSPPKPPENLEDAYKIIVALWHEVVALREENATLHSRIAELEEKLNTNSSNSSMPPSTDRPSTGKRKDKKKKGKRKRGGQPGHEGKTRTLLPKEDVDKFEDCLPDKHCECGGHIELEQENPERHQVLELPEVAVLVWEYLIYSGVCLKCGKVHRGKLPDGVPKGMLGPRAMATVAILSGKYHLSKRNIEEILSDLFGMNICLGTVSNTEARVSEALEEPVEEAKEFVKGQGTAYADETGHKVGGKKAWMWVAVTSFVSVFLIRFSRGQQVAKELLGEAFGGFLVSDRWNAYNWLSTMQRQLCWAHLIRDFTKIAERGGHSEEVGNKLLEYAQKMFHLWHLFVGGNLSRPALQLKMAPIRRGVESLLEEGMTCGHATTERTCKRILKLKEALWTFIDVPDVEPTNNLAERTIRPYVLWRKASFGTQSERGNLFVERMMTVSATCKQQGRNVIDYVTEVISAHLHGDMKPSLLPDCALAEAI